MLVTTLSTLISIEVIMKLHINILKGTCVLTKCVKKELWVQTIAVDINYNTISFNCK